MNNESSSSNPIEKKSKIKNNSPKVEKMESHEQFFRRVFNQPKNKKFLRKSMSRDEFFDFFGEDPYPRKTSSNSKNQKKGKK